MSDVPKFTNSKTEFSKWLLIQESILIWIITITFLILAFVCIKNQYFGELPWLTAMAGFPWTAYGVSQAFYYKKSTAENTKGGIKYETIVGSEDSVGENILISPMSIKTHRAFFLCLLECFRVEFLKKICYNIYVKKIDKNRY